MLCINSILYFFLNIIYTYFAVGGDVTIQPFAVFLTFYECDLESRDEYFFFIAHSVCSGISVTPIKIVIVTTVSSHDEVTRHGKVTRTWRASKNLHKSRFRSLFPRDPACSGDCVVLDRGSQAHKYCAISPERASAP